MDDAEFLKAQSRKCRRLARVVVTRDVVETLLQMAEEYEARAAAIEKRPPAAEA